MKRVIRMMAAVAVTATLAACATTPVKEEIVPVKTVQAETAGRAFECLNYDAATDSCEGIGQWSISGDTATAISDVALADGSEILQMSVTSKHNIVDGKICGLIGEPTIRLNGKNTKPGENFLVDFMGGFLTGIMSETCSTYYRSGDGYFIEAATMDGTVLPDFSGSTQFFAERKTLRASQLQ